MKKYLLILLIVYTSLITCVFAKSTVSGVKKPVSLDRIIAVVNNEVITDFELSKQTSTLKKHLNSISATVPSDDVFRQQILQQLIDKKLQLQVASNMGINVNAKKVNQEIARIAKEKKMTLKDFYLEIQREGWLIENFRNEIRDEIIIQQLQGMEVVSHIQVSPQEVDDFLRSGKGDLNKTSYHLADVLVVLSETPSLKELDRAKKQAEKVVEKLKQVDDFSMITIKERGRIKVLKGEDLGWHKIPELPSIFSSYIFSMNVGDVTNPIQAPNGFHVIKLLGMKKGSVRKMVEESEIQMIVIKYIKNKKYVLKKKVNKLYKSIQKGKDFGKLARRYSEDKETAKHGGYVGWVGPKKFGSKMDDMIMKLAVGKVSQPILMDKGWTIVKVISRRQLPQATDKEKNDIKRFLFGRKIDEALKKFIIDLRNESYIKIYK